MQKYDLSIPASLKAYVALAGSVATALLAVFTADTVVGQVLVVVAVIATAVGTWLAENTPSHPQVNEKGQTNNPFFWLVIAIAIMTFLILLIVAGVIKV